MASNFVLTYTLDIGRNSVGSDGAVALADGLKSCTNLQTLDTL